MPENPALGGSDKGIARTGDLVHGRNRFGAIGQRRNRLRAADAVNRIDPGDARGQQDQRVHHPVGGGAADDKTPDPGHAGGKGVHQDGRRIRRQPARHIKPRRRHRGPAPAQARAGGIFPPGIFGALAVVAGADAVSGQVQGGAVFRRDTGDGRVDLGFGKGHGFGCQRQPVKPGCQLQHGGITPAAHICDDCGHSGIHIPGLFPLHPQQGGEGRLKTGIEGGKENGHHMLPSDAHPPRCRDWLFRSILTTSPFHFLFSDILGGPGVENPRR